MHLQRMGDGIGKPEGEYDRYDPPRSSSDTYFPSGDHLAAYGGRGGTYPGYATASMPDSLYRQGPPHRSGPPPGPPASSSYDNGYSGYSNGYSGYTNGLPPLTLSSLASSPYREPPSLSASPYRDQSLLSSPPPRRQGLSSFGSPQRAALIIWDWDDTLMCSTAINSGRLAAGSAPQLEVLLEESLMNSMALGETLIVTNADDLWVFESTRRFAPRVLSLLSQLPIISARRRQEANFPGDVFAWKRETFREILTNRNTTHGLNLVVLGDSPSEIEAAQTATYGLGIHPLLIKTVKFKEAPTCEELCDQQRLVLQDLSSIVHEEQDSNRNLASRVQSTSFGYLGNGAYRGASPTSGLYTRAGGLTGGLGHGSLDRSYRGSIGGIGGGLSPSSYSSGSFHSSPMMYAA